MRKKNNYKSNNKWLNKTSSPSKGPNYWTVVVNLTYNYSDLRTPMWYNLQTSKIMITVEKISTKESSKMWNRTKVAPYSFNNNCNYNNNNNKCTCNKIISDKVVRRRHKVRYLDKDADLTEEHSTQTHRIPSMET